MQAEQRERVRWTAARRAAHGVLAGLMAVAAGCSNPCQQVCLEMASYAEECGLTVSNDALSACRENYTDAGEEEIKQCQDWDGSADLREWWTCDDVAENFLDGGS